MLGSKGMAPRKFNQSQDSSLSYFNVLLLIKLSSYLKLNIKIIAISVWVGEYFIRVSDCCSRVFRSFAANKGS